MRKVALVGRLDDHLHTDMYRFVDWMEEEYLVELQEKFRWRKTKYVLLFACLCLSFISLVI